MGSATPAGDGEVLPAGQLPAPPPAVSPSPRSSLREAHFRFLSYCDMAGWSEAEALQALPAALDDNALAVLITIPQGDRSTLLQALLHMQEIYGRLSESCHLFANSVLLALARAAFPHMDHEGIDALVLEKLLSLAREMRFVMPAVDEKNVCSLRTARCIQTHLVLQRETSIVACAAPIDAGGPEEEPRHNRVFASTSARSWRSDNRRHQRDSRQQGRASPRQDTASVTCFNCGLQGHVSSGCRATRHRVSGPRSSTPRSPSPSRQSQASRDTTRSRPPLSTRTLYLVTHHHHASDGGKPGGRASVRPFGPGQGTELAHRVVAAAQGSSAIVGSIEGIDVRILVDTGASATIISDLIHNILPDKCRPLWPVDVPCFAANSLPADA
ncbi:unnamed protein product [Lampetra fluviatilis]